MKKLLLVILIATVTNTLLAQDGYYFVKGKVMDESTGQSLQAASVFTQNTTFGTATDAEGNFALRLPNGGYDLVVTYTGYETESKRITTADGDNKNIVIVMKQKDKALETVAIKSSNEVKNGWEVYGDFFIDNFLGKTANSKQCVIKNKEDIKFYFSKKKNRLKVMSEAPIEIVNNALGYTIKYSLDSFTHEYNTQISVNSGFPLFEAHTTADINQLTIWNENRKKAYNGSILHFMRSVYQRTMKENGFEIQFVVKNNEIENTITLKDFYKALNYSKDDSTQSVDIYPNQESVAVIYKKEMPEELFLANQEMEDSSFQLSIVNFLPNQPITIEQNGYYFDQNEITLTGYWNWEKVGDMLPYDYIPN